MAKQGWRTEDLPRLAGVKEALAIFEVQKMTFARWRESGYFDVPTVQEVHGVEEPAQGPLWVREDLVDWNEQHGRQRAPVGAGADTGD